MADEKKKKVDTKKETKKVEAKVDEKKKSTTKKAEESKTVNKEKATTTTKAATKKVESKKEVVKNNEDELVATATVKYARISSRKVKIVADLIRGKNVDEALAILQFTQKAGSEILIKLLNSAIANAENNNQMTHSKLYIAEIYSNQGPTLKRIRPAAKGSAVRIRKRTSHTTIVLKERD
ncbi:MAG: 50S ribosomal protein L22 [Clostridia bacterium]|nr:50S ribosomal protein L22 [Clostridia bacterium]